MPRLSRGQELARRQIADLAGSGLGAGQLGERILAAIQPSVSFDGAQLCGLDPATLLFNRLLAVSSGMLPHTDWYLRHLYLNEPLVELTHPGLMRAGLTAVVLHDRPETSWGLPKLLTGRLPASELSRTFHQVTGARGGILRAFFPARSQWIAALDLARFDPGEPFRPADVAFLRLVAPLIGQALRLAFDRERAAAGADTAGLEGCGVLVLGPDGNVQSSNPAAESWLNVLQGADASLDRHLPAAIWSAIAGLRAGGRGSAQVSVRVPARAGQLRVEAAPLGADGTVAVVLVPPSPPAAPAIPEGWNLTRHERQVVELVVRGLSNRQIAATLVVTEHTVESHLKHLYEKLNVHSRSQLLARYFAEVYQI